MNPRALPVLRGVVVVLVIAIVVVAGALINAVVSGGPATPRTEGERAVVAAEEAVKANPNDATARVKLAAAYLAQNSPAGALRQAQIAVRLAPKDPAPYYVLGLAQLKQGDTKQAIASLTKAADTKGQQAGFYQDVYTSLGRAYEADGDVKKALEAMGKAIDKGPENVPLLVERAQLFERQKKWFEAALDFGWALRYTPDYEEARSGLDRMKTDHPAEYKKAVAAIERDSVGDTGPGMQDPFASAPTTGTK